MTPIRSAVDAKVWLPSTSRFITWNGAPNALAKSRVRRTIVRSSRRCDMVEGMQSSERPPECRSITTSHIGKSTLVT
jgi:hypothetical protein